MKAYKCDRCQKLFEHYQGQGTSDYYNVTRNPNFKDDLVDLCPKCNKKLQKWMKKAESEVEHD